MVVLLIVVLHKIWNECSWRVVLWNAKRFYRGCCQRKIREVGELETVIDGYRGVAEDVEVKRWTYMSME